MYTRRWCWYIHLVQVTHTQPDKGRCVYTQETPACNQMDLVAAEVNELYRISVGSYLCMQLNKELPLTGNLYHISRIGSTIILVLTLVRCWNDIFNIYVYWLQYPDFPFLNILFFVCAKNIELYLKENEASPLILKYMAPEIMWVHNLPIVSKLVSKFALSMSGL